ncbi:MAG: cytochrome c biogenesis protein ResB [bacterium]|nr:cytochrome c biogenesis protein ResB [bacterium]
MLPKYLRPLASIGLTVVLLVLIAIAMVYGTIYESIAGTPLAQADVYKSMWFDFLLGLLAINLTACTLNRYPYRPHQVGWLLTHLGILIILAGAVIGRNWGIEGQVMLAEGQSTNKLSLNTHKLEVRFASGDVYEMPLYLEHLPRREGMKPRVVPLPNSKGEVTLHRFLPSGRSKTSLVDDPKHGVVAILLEFQAPMARQEQWLWSGSEEASKWDLPMVGRIRVFDSQMLVVPIDSIPIQMNEFQLIALSEKFLLRRLSQTGLRLDTVPVGQMFAFSGANLGFNIKQRRDKVSLKEEYEPIQGRGGVPSLLLSAKNARGEKFGPVWLPFGANVISDELQAMFKMTALEVDLGFVVELVDFKRTFYPGTNQAASFSSDVIVHNHKEGDKQVHISMNNPMVYKGYKFFQSSFIEGTPEYSVFSVGYDPGVPIVYAGCIILVLGLIGIIFFKSYLKKKFPVKSAVDSEES